MPKKMGRPKIDNPKEIQVTARLTPQMLDKLEENAKFYNETKADSIRRGIEEVNKGVKK